MTSNDKGTNRSQSGTPAMSIDYGQRAASALDLLTPGPHRDKRIARLFGVSVRTAKYLRAGKRWTAERLTQASQILGNAFDAALSGPALNQQRDIEFQEIEARLRKLEIYIAEMDRRNIARLASHQGFASGGGGRNVAGGGARQSE